MVFGESVIRVCMVFGESVIRVWMVFGESVNNLNGIWWKCY